MAKIGDKIAIWAIAERTNLFVYVALTFSPREPDKKASHLRD